MVRLLNESERSRWCRDDRHSSDFEAFRGCVGKSIADLRETSADISFSHVIAAKALTVALALRDSLNLDSLFIPGALLKSHDELFVTCTLVATIDSVLLSESMNFRIQGGRVLEREGHFGQAWISNRAGSQPTYSLTYRVGSHFPEPVPLRTISESIDDVGSVETGPTRELKASKTSPSTMQVDYAQLANQVFDLSTTLSTYHAALTDALLDVEPLRQEITALRSSRSWLLTAPLRRLRQRIRTIR